MKKFLFLLLFFVFSFHSVNSQMLSKYGYNFQSLPTPGLKSNSITDLFVVDETTIWLGTGEGLSKTEDGGKTWQTFTDKNYQPELRKKGDDVYITDGGHYLADLHLGAIGDPFKLDMELKKIPGVLEHGLFLNMVNKVVSAGNDTVEILTFR